MTMRQKDDAAKGFALVGGLLLLAAALLAFSCGPVHVTPADVCRVAPELCVQPSPSPVPSASPTPAPSASPSPLPSVEPSASPVPSPSPVATPSPEPTPTPAPTPVPTPAPAPTNCPPSPPAKLLKPEVPLESRCPVGFDERRWKGHQFCIAKSSCPGKDGECAHALLQLLGQGDMELVDGFFYDGERGYFDTYCRRGAESDGAPFPGESGSWLWSGWCGPKVCEPKPAPSPTPAPTPTPGKGHCDQPIARLALGPFGGEGDKHNFQITYRFGNGNGKPCDGGHLACEDPAYLSCQAHPPKEGCGQCEVCGGAVCEDPRGGDWSAFDGATVTSVSDGIEPYGFMATVKGKGRVRVCVPPDPRSREGNVPLKVNQQCEERAIE